MGEKRIVILGNGVAALSAVESVRRIDRECAITVVSGEDVPAYSKVLIPYLISGERSDIRIRTQAYYEKTGVETVFGKMAVGIGTDSLLLDDGQELPYDKLLLSPGASPIMPEIPGAKASGVFSINTLEDAKAIARHIENAAQVVFIGGGRMCLHVVDAFLNRGLRVCIIESAPEILLSMLDLDGAKIIRRKLEERGATVYTGVDATEIKTDGGKVYRVVAGAGTEIDADIVIASIGNRPNLEVPKTGGITAGRGVQVDDMMRTNLDNVFAAGDVTETFNLIRRDERIVCGTWFEAVQQGRIAGINMAGGTVSYGGSLKMNVIGTESVAATSIGEIEPPDDSCKVTASCNGDEYRKIIVKNDQIIGAVLIGEVSDAGIIVSMMRNGTRLSRHAVIDLRRKLKVGPLFKKRRPV